MIAIERVFRSSKRRFGLLPPIDVIDSKTSNYFNALVLPFDRRNQRLDRNDHWLSRRDRAASFHAAYLHAQPLSISVPDMVATTFPPSGFAQSSARPRSLPAFRCLDRAPIVSTSCMSSFCLSLICHASILFHLRPLFAL